MAAVEPTQKGQAPLTTLSEPARSHSESLRLTLYITTFFVVWTVRAFGLAGYDQAPWPFAVHRVYLDAIRFLLWVLPVLLYLRFVDQVDVLNYLRLNTPIDSRGLSLGITLAALYLTFSILLGAWLKGHALHSPFALSTERWFRMMVMFPFAAFAEEILFRGFLLRKAAEIGGFWKANLTIAVLFMLIHWPGWLAAGNGPAGVLAQSPGVFALGFLLGYLVKITGSLWPSVAVHILNNVLVSAVG
jgi:membrane protease YdiL (CAAX protease family)